MGGGGELRNTSPRGASHNYAYLDIGKHDTATSHILVLHQFLRVLPLLIRLLLKELGEPFQSDVIPIKITILSKQNNFHKGTRWNKELLLLPSKSMCRTRKAPSLFAC